MALETEKVTCPQCGLEYDYDRTRNCWQCDGPACPHCLGDEPEPLCPECKFGDMPAHIEPMLAKRGKMPADPSAWAFEYKWDGMRALAYWQAGRFCLESRNLRDVTARYPDLVPEPDEMPDTGVILDGEIVALDEGGHPSFPLLQKRMHASAALARRRAQEVPVSYFVFDVLWRGGESLTDRPYEERRRTLESLEFDHSCWVVPASHIGEGPAMLRVAKSLGLEGLMAKRRGSPYLPGERSNDWRKIKIVHTQEFVIGGWTPREGNERQVANLLLGYYTEKDLGLQYAGRVGTGFSAETHERLLTLLKSREKDESPFAGDGPSGSDMRFVAPTLVAQIAYNRWPEGGGLHQASFKGLRKDVQPHEIVIGERS
jgi:bifunctional non-homologous end joining protein LigD